MTPREFDEFPKNRHNLRNGVLIEALRKEVEEQLGIQLGRQIAIGWNGECVRGMGGLDWSLEGLCREIDLGFWKVTDLVLDLKDPKVKWGFTVMLFL